MTTTRRIFMQNMSGVAAATFVLPSFLTPEKISMINKSIRELNISSTGGGPDDEDFWSMIRQAYSVSSEMLNLNNGGVSPQPIHVAEQEYRYTQMCNEGPAYFMWQILDQGREPLRKKLALLTGVSPDELAINRNSSEGLETIIFGLNLKAGDEVIVSKQDYNAMQFAWQQREKRDNIKLVWLNFDLPQESDDYFVTLYKGAVTNKTKAVLVTHMINWTGQILPIRKISDAVKAINPNIDIISDSAQSFAQMDFKIPDQGCDYWATSLHKWLGAPFGTGLLYVKKEKIASVWPLSGNENPLSDDIRKFESLGTRSFPAEQAIGDAIEFHNAIGIARKEARFRYLMNYWVNKVKDHPKIKIHTSQLPQYSCGIGTFSIDGLTYSEVNMALSQKYKITVTPIGIDNINVIRVTPNMYTSLADLDYAVKCIREIADNPSIATDLNKK
jgi:selenocysteine lyase/cysteine desulfurase